MMVYDLSLNERTKMLQSTMPKEAEEMLNNLNLISKLHCFHPASKYKWICLLIQKLILLHSLEHKSEQIPISDHSEDESNILKQSSTLAHHVKIICVPKKYEIFFGFMMTSTNGKKECCN